MAQPSGRIAFDGRIASKSLGASRWLRVYLPPSYDQQPEQRFPVLYVHDGQNAFSSVGDHVAFGWGNWRLDQTASHLAAAKRMSEIILVAIDCGDQRYAEYRGPAYPHSSSQLLEARGSATRSSSDQRFLAYSRFLRKELKPRIDAEYRTAPGPKTTGVLGSSMGGICSLTLAWCYPRVFGLAASLSGAFQVERKNFIVNTLRPYQGRPKAIRIYLDSGIMDDGGGDDGRKYTEAVAQELTRIGWRKGINLEHFIDDHVLTDDELAAADTARHKWTEAKISQHNELYWRLRAWRALTFLFPP